MVGGSSPRPHAARGNGTLFLALAPVAAALFLLVTHGADPDLFWHLRVAELVSARGPGPLLDTFSYNSLPTPWLPYSWLAELGMLVAVDLLGSWALLVVPLVCLLATLFLLGAAVCAGTDDTVKAGVILGTATLLMLPFLALRPATLALPLCALASWVVTDPRPDRSPRLRLLGLIPLTALLANLHLYFLFPPMLLLARAAGEAWGRPVRGGLVAAAPFAGIAAASLLAGFLLTPDGPALLRIILHYLFQDVMVGEAAILEMRPFYELGPLLLVGTSLLLLWPSTGLLKKLRVADRRDLVYLACAIALTLAGGRYVPLAVLLLAPLAGRHGPWPQRRPMPRWSRATALGGAIGLVAAATLSLAREQRPYDLDAYLERDGTYPVAAARFVRDSLPDAAPRLINEMGWGGFLIYTLAPDFQVMLDGRTQVYPERLWRAAYVEPTRESRLTLVRRSGADVAVLANGSRWAPLLREQPDWRALYRDSVATVWARRRS